jgi:hypothetical protein
MGSSITGSPGQFINTVGFMQPVTVAQAAAPEKNFEFCKDGGPVDWAKFTMWLRGFLSAIEGQPLTPESVGKIMEKLAYVDPERKLSYTQDPFEQRLQDMLKLADLQKQQQQQQIGQPYPQIYPHHQYIPNQWVSNPQICTPDDRPDRWLTTTGKQLLNDLKVYCSNAVSKQPANSAAASSV